MTSLPLCSRPLRTVLSLPDELLLDIFESLKTNGSTKKSLYPDLAGSSSDIAAARLTCRRFAATSSHLLVHYIRLDSIDSHSLEKLEAISHHPLIGKGVRIIRFEARCYVPNLAEDVGEFARWVVGRVLDMARCYRGSFEKEMEISMYSDCNDTESQVTKRDNMASVLRRLKVVLDSWSSLSIKDWQQMPIHRPTAPGLTGWQQEAPVISGSIESQAHIQLLREAHDVYRRRYQDQEELRKDNAFVARFAAAMSRMPKAKCLEIQDFHHGPNICLPCCDGDGVTHALRDVHKTDEYAGLLNIDSFLQPLSWVDTIDQHFGSPPAELLFTLPVALQGAGCNLDSILVRTTTRAEDYYPLLSDSHQDSFAALGYAISTIGLKSFAFIHGIDPKARTRRAPPVKDLEAFKRYITAMTSSEDLERFRLVVDSGWVDGSFDSENETAFGSLLSSKLWTSLKDIHVAQLPIHLDDLSSLYRSLENSDTSLDFLTLSRLKLVSGSWTEALEILRKMDVTDKELLEPTGAECDSFPRPPCSRYGKIFGTNPQQGNEAEQFINGLTERNPLKGTLA